MGRNASLQSSRGAVMDFYDMLDQVVTLLRARGRVTYRALKVQFALDDEHLDALKEELLYSQPQVIDDHGRGLLVYFGYPQAHEDDAQRVVRTGLGILESMGTLNTRLVRDQGVRLAVRIG